MPTLGALRRLYPMAPEPATSGEYEPDSVIPGHDPAP